MIFNLSMFNGEQEILEIRLNQLCEVVDYFVLGSCARSHSGMNKGINCPNSDIWAKFKEKILFFEIPFIESNDPWVNEGFGREFLYEKIKDRLKNDDILLVDDLDEIPNPEAVKEESKKLTQPVTFCGEYFIFCFDLWGRKSIDGFLIKNEWKTQTLNWFRSHRTNWTYNHFKHILNSSHHFSSVMTPEDISKKMSYFAHCNEFVDEVRNPEYIRKLIIGKCGNFKLDQPNVLTEYPIKKLPTYLQNNADKFKHLFYSHYVQ